MAKKLKYNDGIVSEVHTNLNDKITTCGKNITVNPEHWIYADNEETTCPNCLKWEEYVANYGLGDENITETKMGDNTQTYIKGNTTQYKEESKEFPLLKVIIFIVIAVIIGNILFPEQDDYEYEDDSDYASEDSNDSSWGDIKPDDDASYEEWDAYFKKHPEAIMEEIEEMEEGWGN